MIILKVWSIYCWKRKQDQLNISKSLRFVFTASNFTSLWFSSHHWLDHQGEYMKWLVEYLLSLHLSRIELSICLYLNSLILVFTAFNSHEKIHIDILQHKHKSKSYKLTNKVNYIKKNKKKKTEKAVENKVKNIVTK